MHVGRGCHICAFALALGLYRQKCVAGPRQGKRLAELALLPRAVRRLVDSVCDPLTLKSPPQKPSSNSYQHSAVLLLAGSGRNGPSTR